VNRFEEVMERGFCGGGGVDDYDNDDELLGSIMYS
jgi:hypothetical protein